MKRVLALVLSLLMAVCVVAGCSKNSATTDTESGKDTASAADSKPESTEPVTLTVITPDKDSQYSLKDSDNYKKIQKILLEKFNVDWQCEFAVSKNYEEMVTTRLSSSDLPDAANIGFDMSKVIQLYQSGVIVKLNELIEKNAPDITSLYQQKPLVKVANADSDGNILRIPGAFVENPQHRFSVLEIRNDWLKMIGKTYEDIKTPDDFYTALKAFQEKDVNGNGQKDEVLNCWNAAQLGSVVGTAFGAVNITGAANAWYTDDSGKVYNTLVTDNAKAFLTFAHKLYAEGLLNNNYESQTGDEYNQLQYNNQVAANIDAWWGATVYNDAMEQKDYKDADMIQLARPLSENDKPMTYLADMSGYSGFMITKSCKDPDKLMQVLNYGYTVEGSQINYYGEAAPGGDYYETVKDLPDGINLPEYYMAYTEKGRKAYEEDSLLWDKMGWNSQIIPQCLLGNMDVIAYNDTVEGKEAKLSYTYDFNYSGLKEATETSAVPAIHFATATSEQIEKLTAYADLFTYMDEQFSKFVSGAESLDNWDAFVQKCSDMDLAGATAIFQTRYEAYQQIVK